MWQTLYDYHDLILGEYICIAKVVSMLKVDMGLSWFFFLYMDRRCIYRAFSAVALLFWLRWASKHRIMYSINPNLPFHHQDFIVRTEVQTPLEREALESMGPSSISHILHSG